MQDTNLKHSWDLYAGSHANGVSMIAKILATFLREAYPHFGAYFWVTYVVASKTSSV